MTDNFRLLQEFLAHEVEFVVVGGVAAAFHGSSLTTYDLDLCIPFTEQNLGRVLPMLVRLHARFRAHPAKPPLQADPKVYRDFRHLLLDTDLGAIDLLREIAGLGDFSQVLACSQVLDQAELPCRVLRLESLIVAKRAAGRDKDLRALPELEILAAKMRT